MQKYSQWNQLHWNRIINACKEWTAVQTLGHSIQFTYQIGSSQEPKSGVKIICLTREFYKRPEDATKRGSSGHKRGNNKRATIMTFGANEWEAGSNIRSSPLSPFSQSLTAKGYDSSLEVEPESVSLWTWNPNLNFNWNWTWQSATWSLALLAMASFLVVLGTLALWLLVIFLLPIVPFFWVPYASRLGDIKRWENVKKWQWNVRNFCLWVVARNNCCGIDNSQKGTNKF